MISSYLQNGLRMRIVLELTYHTKSELSSNPNFNEREELLSRLQDAMSHYYLKLEDTEYGYIVNDVNIFNEAIFLVGPTGMMRGIIERLTRTPETLSIFGLQLLYGNDCYE